MRTSPTGRCAIDSVWIAELRADERVLLFAQRRTLSPDCMGRNRQQSVASNVALAALTIPAARTDTYPAAISLVVATADHQHHVVSWRIIGHSEHRNGSILPLPRVLLIGHPSPHNLTRIGLAVGLRGIGERDPAAIAVGPSAFGFRIGFRVVCHGPTA